MIIITHQQTEVIMGNYLAKILGMAVFCLSAVLLTLTVIARMKTGQFSALDSYAIALSGMLIGIFFSTLGSRLADRLFYIRLDKKENSDR